MGLPPLGAGRAGLRGRAGASLVALRALPVAGGRVAFCQAVESCFSPSPGFSAAASLSRRVRADGQEIGIDGAGGEDPRDLWLARALEHPADFARYIAGHNLAEQELWVERLSERAQARGLLGELVDALRGAGDEKAVWLADDFAAQAKAAESGDSVDPEETSSGTESAKDVDLGR